MSNNKAGKYFKYAIGEIILVVIGILIALQINNWNISNENRAQEQQYIKRLIQELDNEIVNYDRLKTGFTRQQSSINTLLEFWNQPNPVLKDSTAFWSNFFAATGAGPWYQKPVTWTQLVQSGELKLIKDQFAIETLLKHYSNLERVAENFSEYPTQTTNEARKLTAITFSETDFVLNTTDNLPFTPNPQVIQKILDRKTEFKPLFVRVGIIASFHIGQMNDLSESAQNAKMILEKNLKKK